MNNTQLYTPRVDKEKIYQTITRKLAKATVDKIFLEREEESKVH